MSKPPRKGYKTPKQSYEPLTEEIKYGRSGFQDEHEGKEKQCRQRSHVGVMGILTTLLLVSHPREKVEQ